MTSISSDDMAEVTSKSVMDCQALEIPVSQPSITEATGTVRKAYMCPKCNMGIGHKRQKYRGVARHYIDDKSQWDKPTTFKNHIMEDHIDDFKRPNSSEYVCRYCICTAVGQDGSHVCPARFKTEQAMVDHLLDFHAKGPRRLAWLEHRCAPISDHSYPPPLQDALKQLA